MRLVMHIMETASSSDSSHESEEEILDSFDTLQTQVETFLPIVDSITTRIQALQTPSSNTRKSLLTDTFPFRSTAIAEWFGEEQGRIVDFFRKVLEEGVVKTDMESRRLWLQPRLTELLGLPQRGIYLYEFLRVIPRWMEICASQ